MRNRVTMLLAALLFVAALPAAAQQQVTIREINAIPQDQVATLNSLGTQVTETNMADNGDSLIFNPLINDEVQFTAVVVSDPLNSGLASPDDDGLPGRVHFFVRDVAAETEGKEGMTIQIVDGAWQDNGVEALTVGDVVQIVGVVDPFFTTMQVAPTSLTLLGKYNDGFNFNLSDDILDPVTITTAEANAAAGEGTVLINWDNLASLRNQYVRVEDAIVIDRDVSSDRPNWTISSDGGQTFLSFYDTSLRYRNDQSDYNADRFNVRDDDYVPPPIGARVNVQGFLTMNSDDPFERAASEDIILSFNPMNDGDVEITEAPPVITNITRPDFVPGTEPVELSFDVVADPERNVTGVELRYTTSSSTDEETVAATLVEGNTYAATLPAQADGDFVTYYVVATDDQGGISSTEGNAQSIRFLADGIDAIEDIQLTADGGPGSSPFAGITTDMSLTATVQSNPSVSGLFTIQDDADQSPWTGVFVALPEGTTVNPGDEVEITQATITEDFGVTTLTDAVLTVTSTGGERIAYKAVPTSVLQDENIAEAHEGMLLRFDDVTITSTNPDAPSGPFGEWAFSSDGTEDNAVRADDASDAVSFVDNAASEVFTEGYVYDFIQGVWWFSFGNYKLVPEDLATDVGAVISTDVEDDVLPGGFALDQNYPNPFNPSTEITYTVGQSGPVTLAVYDMLGRRVAVLADAQMAPGTYTATFDATDLASGLYLYRLTAQGTTLTRSMVLLK